MKFNSSHTLELLINSLKFFIKNISNISSFFLKGEWSKVLKVSYIDLSKLPSIDFSSFLSVELYNIFTLGNVIFIILAIIGLLTLFCAGLALIQEEPFTLEWRVHVPTWENRYQVRPFVAMIPRNPERRRSSDTKLTYGLVPYNTEYIKYSPNTNESRYGRTRHEHYLLMDENDASGSSLIGFVRGDHKLVMFHVNGREVCGILYNTVTSALRTEQSVTGITSYMFHNFKVERAWYARVSSQGTVTTKNIPTSRNLRGKIFVIRHMTRLRFDRNLRTLYATED